MTINRRKFIAATSASAFAGWGACALTPREEGRDAPWDVPNLPRIIDANVSLSRWPTRRSKYDSTKMLAEKLRRCGIEQAWAGSFDALLHKDIGAVNDRLAEECRREGAGVVVPFGAINPKLPDWEEELRRCAENRSMRGIRIHPNYHGYGLDDPDFVRMFDLAARRRMIIQIAVHIEDERMMNPLMKAAPVETAPLAELAGKTPEARIVLLNAMNVLSGEPLDRLLAAGKIYVEIAALEGVGGVGNLLKKITLKQILFGSNAPLFYLESALMKLRESEISVADINAICRDNAVGIGVSGRD